MYKELGLEIEMTEIKPDHEKAREIDWAEVKRWAAYQIKIANDPRYINGAGEHNLALGITALFAQAAELEEVKRVLVEWIKRDDAVTAASRIPDQKATESAILALSVYEVDVMEPLARRLAEGAKK